MFRERNRERFSFWPLSSRKTEDKADMDVDSFYDVILAAIVFNGVESAPIGAPIGQLVELKGRTRLQKLGLKPLENHIQILKLNILVLFLLLLHLHAKVHSEG